MTDKEIINMHAKYGGGPVTKESILSEHQKYGGPILTWDQLKNQHCKRIPAEIRRVRLEGTLEEGLTEKIIGDIKDKRNFKMCNRYEEGLKLAAHSMWDETKKCPVQVLDCYKQIRTNCFLCSTCRSLEARPEDNGLRNSYYTKSLDCWKRYWLNEQFSCMQSG